MQVCVVDYGSGNLQSVQQALVAAAAGTADIQITSQPEDVAAADAVVLPGVGAFGDCAAALTSIDGMIEALNETVWKQARPFLGICVGMQLMASLGREGGETPGLGWIKGEVEVLTPDNPSLKIPHMGWNSLHLNQDHPVWNDIDEGAAVYFLHGYAFSGTEGVLAETDYGGPVVASIGVDTVLGVQFHPEKSQQVGQRILSNWLAWKP